jgi:hypothetical protein
MDILSFIIGFVAASAFFIYQGNKYRRLKRKETSLTLKLEPTRQALIEKVNGKYHVLDAKTNKYLGEFTSWGKLAELLISVDGSATWSIKHNLPELDQRYDEET